MSDKRQQLESIATDAVQRGGLHNLSFRTLADRAGVKSSSVHYYFPEKSHLAAALIEGYSADFSAKLGKISASKSTTLKKLDAFVKLFEDAVSDDKFCLCGMMAAEVESLDATNRAALRKYFQNTENWLSRVIAEGTPNDSLKSRTVARVLLSGLEGATLLDRIDGSRQHLKAQRELLHSLIAN